MLSDADLIAAAARVAHGESLRDVAQSMDVHPGSLVLALYRAHRSGLADLPQRRADGLLTGDARLAALAKLDAMAPRSELTIRPSRPAQLDRPPALTQGSAWML